MAGFNAATAVDPLDFDFSKYGGPTGVIPEPSTKQVEAFLNTAQDVAKLLGIAPGQALSVESISAIPQDAAEKMNALMTERVLELCAGEITEEDLDKLPFRVRSAFTAWLAGELAPDPTTPAAATRR